MAALLCTGTGFAQQPPPPYPQPPYPQPYYQRPPPPYPQPHYYPPQPYPQRPYSAPYPQPAPPPFQPELDPKKLEVYEITEPNYGLIAGGVVLFVASYAVPLIVAGAKGFTNESQWLAIPLFGDLVTMSKRSWGEDNAAIGLGLTLAGLYQHAGVALLAVGASSTHTRTERTWAWAPLITSDAFGAQLVRGF